MRRRDFIGLLGDTALWPLASQAQQTERMRGIGILLNAAANDPKFKTWVGAFLQGLQQLGWTDGHNVRIDTRWAGGPSGKNPWGLFGGAGRRCRLRGADKVWMFETTSQVWEEPKQYQNKSSRKCGGEGDEQKI